MLVSLNWLHDYVEVKDLPLDVLRKKMSSAGLSVERQHMVGEGIEAIVIGRIVEKEKHPDSDHLWICKVDVGKEPILQIVTGAQNIEIGQKVPVIQNGSSLPDGTEIITSKLRGVESQGMMCSAKELGLGDDHGGILILDEQAPVGALFAEYYGFPDIVLDIEITPNRGDLMSVVGIAREVSVLIDRPLKMPELKELSSSRTETAISVEIEDSADCDRFAALAVKGDFSVQTPFYIQQRLVRAGMRPISLLVDISNYVMLEIGQPSHAYDARLITNNHFHVRRAHYGEKLELLDGSLMELDPHNLVVADKEKILGLAGIMGGEASKVVEDTDEIILEAAHFDGVVIRKTTMSKNVRSEASARFERKVDSILPPIALQRFYTLLSGCAPVHISSTLTDKNFVPPRYQEVTLRSSLLHTYLGKDLTLGYVERILTSLGFEMIEGTHAGEHGGWRIKVSVPSWRLADVSIEEDLIEEIARIYGYDNIPSSTPKGVVPTVRPHTIAGFREQLVRMLVSRGWWELLTYSFTSEEHILHSGYTPEQAVKVHNPLSVEHSYMRISLLPNLLDLVHKNLPLYGELAVFEQSRVYHQRLYPILPESFVNETLEREHIAMILADKSYTFDTAYSKLYAEIAMLISTLRVKNIRFVQNEEIIHRPNGVMFHPGRVAAIYADETYIGMIGEIHPRLQKLLQLEQPVMMAELDVELMIPEQEYVSYRDFSMFPKTTESLSVLVDEHIAVGEMRQVIKASDNRIVEVSVREPYRGEGVPAGKKAITFDVSYQKVEGVVSDKEAATLRKTVTDLLSTTFNAAIRTSS